MQSFTSPPAADPLRRLRVQVRGRVIGPDTASYDRARTVFDGGIDRRPAVIVQAADAADVSRVVEVASDEGLEIAVRSGGHSLARHGTTDGGIVLDLGDLNATHIDLKGRTAWTEAGLTTGA